MSAFLETSYEDIQMESSSCIFRNCTSCLQHSKCRMSCDCPKPYAKFHSIKDKTSRNKEFNNFFQPPERSIMVKGLILDEYAVLINDDIKLYLKSPKTSWQLAAWILKYSNLRKNSKLVSAHLALHYNVKQKKCFPSLSTLQRETGLSRVTVSKGIEQIKNSGEWIVMPPGSLRSNQYLPNIGIVPIPCGFSPKSYN